MKDFKHKKSMGCYIIDIYVSTADFKQMLKFAICS